MRTPATMTTEALLEERETYNNLITKYGLDTADVLNWLWRIDEALEARGIK
ncbi:hypothetical protein [Amycolatopsis kentuckyensis]|uniref:hypothetical protein n=1 Tax=Amycolatopsis kentuckyensis TaxID=218823 RepID=UPI0013026590|nr:hypothetical protein [Amycolatopsis kentuckyensis]